jgi:hypothetical protein
MFFGILLAGARNMSKERISELQEMLFNLERKIKPLEWDSSRNQINEFKKKTLEALKAEHSTFAEELNGLENSE